MHIIDRLSTQLEETANGCWEWIGARNQYGYGVISFLGRQHRVHRLVWELEYGTVTKGMLICHHCDNRLCCNPTHLFAGTYQDNVDDMVAKGRDSFGDNIGANNGQAKLLNDDVLAIRRFLSSGYTQQHIANIYKVSRTTVSLIKSRKNWGWLQ